MTSITRRTPGRDRRREDHRRPGLVDNLAIVSTASPTPALRRRPRAGRGTTPRAAYQLTDPSKGQYGWLIPADSSEDTVWHYIPMLWEAGGDDADSRQHTPRRVQLREAGVRALTALRDMAVTDKSLYLDTTNENGPKLMNSGKVAMLVTGPWDL